MQHELPRTWKVAAVWLLIALALFLGFRAFERESRQTRFTVSGDVIEIRRSGDGHYRWPGRINGRPVEFLIDTGATGTAIPAPLADELGLVSLGAVSSMTAGGPVRGHEVRADVTLHGGVSAERLRMTALPGLAQPLLGMNVLGRLRWQQRDGVLRIEADR